MATNALKKGTRLRRKTPLHREVIIISGPLEDEDAAGGAYYQVEFPDGDSMDIAVECIGPGESWEIAP